MEKKIICSLGSLVIMLLCIMIQSSTVQAIEIKGHGFCGEIGKEENISWNLDADGTLTIAGTGKMADYSEEDGNRAPWYDKRKFILKIEIDGVSKIGNYAFYETNTKEINFKGNSLTEIGDYSFYQNKNLLELNLPEGLVKIGDYSFYHEESLTDITFPESLRIIGTYTFCLEERWVVQDLVLPNLTQVGNAAFACDDFIINLHIPGTLEEIADGAFGSCSYVGTIYVEEGVKKIHREAFGSARCVMLPSTIEYLEDDHIFRNAVFGKNEYTSLWAINHDLLYVDLTKKYDIADFQFYNPPSIFEYTGEEIKIDAMSFYCFNSDYSDVLSIDLQKGVDYDEEYIDNVDVGTAKLKLIGRGIFEGSETIYTYKICDYIHEEDVTLSDDKFLYTGSEIKPTVTVKRNNTILTEGIDYTISYHDNIEEGKAKVTIRGNDFLWGDVDKTFNIFKYDLTNSELSISYSSILYDGTQKTPSVKVTFDGKEVDPSNYTIAYANNINEGMATVTITGIGTYKGSVTKQFEIYKYNLKDATISADATTFTYDGAAHSPNISVTYDGKALKADTDYKLTISPSVDAGIYKAVIDGMGQYTGTREIEYTIDPIVIDNADVVLKDNIFTYDGSAKKPSTTVIHAGTTLTEGTHYTLTYKNNIDEGTAYAVVDGINNYSGHIEVSFMILAYQSGMDAVYKEDDTIMDGDFIYHIIDVERKEVELSAPANTKTTEVVVPAKITTENGDVFTVTSIGEKAFYKNSKIKKLTVANTVTSIENYAFYGCKNLTTIKIGNKIEIIGDSAFRKCTKLTSITLPKSIDKLGKNSFYGCSKLTTIVIKSNQVVDVSKNAIKGISKKCVIKVPKKLVKKYKKEFDKNSGFKSTMKIKKI